MEEYDPQIMRQFMDELQRTGKVTKETSDQIAASGSTTEKYLQNLGKASKSASQDILKGAKDMASGLIEGQRGFEQLTPVLDAAASAIGGLVSIIPIFGKALEAGTQLVAEGGKLMLRQISTQLKSFQDISDVGAGALDGMTGLQKQFLSSGLSLEDYTARVRSSSQALARFRGLANSGAEDFAQITGTITRGRLGDQLRLLGLSASDIGEFAEGFITRSTRLGTAQTMTNAQLSRATVEYARELDQLSKATGLSRKAIMSQQDAAMSEARFRSTLEGIQNEGVRQNLLNFQTSVNAVSAGIGQGVRDLTSGFFNTEEAQALMIQTGGAAAEIVNSLKTGQIDEFEARRRLQSALEGNRQLLTDLGPAIGDASLATRNAAGVFDLINADLTASGFKLNQQQNQQIIGADGMTQSAVTAQKSIEQMNISMQALFFNAMPAATKIVEQFTGTVSKGLQKLADEFGIDLPRIENIGKPLNERMVSEIKSSIQGSGGSTKIGDFVAPGMSREETIALVKDMQRSKIRNITEQDIKIASQYGVEIAKQFNRASGGTKAGDLGITGYGSNTTVAGLKDMLAGLQTGTTTGPKTSYSSTSASLTKLEGSVGQTADTTQMTAQNNSDEILKNIHQQQMITNDILTKGNKIGQQQVRATYS